MKNLSILFLGFIVYFSSYAQIDTINTNTIKLNIAAFKERKSSYAVFFTDSAGNRISSADIWDRSITFSTNGNNISLYNFSWKWYKKDSLIATVSATGTLPNLRPVAHYADYGKYGKFGYLFNDNIVTIPATYKPTAKDSAFKVVLNPPAFDFPMDMETFALLPFKKINQQFAIAFYEPGTPKSDYYKLTVTGKEDMLLVGGAKVNCWILKIDYDPDSYATFWITDKTREVVKMQEYYKGKYRYKVKLY
jgi:hypothetical protein